MVWLEHVCPQGEKSSGKLSLFDGKTIYYDYFAPVLHHCALLLQNFFRVKVFFDDRGRFVDGGGTRRHQQGLGGIAAVTDVAVVGGATAVLLLLLHPWFWPIFHANFDVENIVANWDN